MKKIICQYCTSSDEFESVVKYHSYYWSIYNIIFIVIACVFCFNLYFLTEYIHITRVIVVFSIIALNTKFSTIKDELRRFRKLSNKKIDMEITFTNDHIEYKNINMEKISVQYQNIMYITEISKYIILIVKKGKEKTFVPVKKECSNIEDSELKKILIKRCKNPKKMKVTSAYIIHNILFCCQLAYIILLFISLTIDVVNM